jgi:hypothetical protein
VTSVEFVTNSGTPLGASCSTVGTPTLTFGADLRVGFFDLRATGCFEDLLANAVFALLRATAFDFLFAAVFLFCAGGRLDFFRFGPFSIYGPFPNELSPDAATHRDPNSFVKARARFAKKHAPR